MSWNFAEIPSSRQEIRPSARWTPAAFLSGSPSWDKMKRRTGIVRNAISARAILNKQIGVTNRR
jgi:hypothetical protein